jgi:very-short-patch-repair endonuclease
MSQVTCQICNETFSSNRGGQLTVHLKKDHQITLRDYVIETMFQGFPPKCCCGICNDLPVFSRGTFLRYAKNHRRFDVREKLWRKKNGDPKCQRDECNENVGFRRGEPKTYCSSRCAGLSSGFSLSETQSAIREVVLDRYGVKNVRNLPQLKERAKERLAEMSKQGLLTPSDETRQKLSEASIEFWQRPGFREEQQVRIREGIRSSASEIQRRQRWMTEAMQDPDFVEKVWAGHRNRLSNLHRRRRDEMNLVALGFESEQRVGRFWADELHKNKKIILEVHGDYPHANPAKYKADDVIRLQGQSYTAQEKWDMDYRRRKELEQAGYAVFVVWESDDIEERQQSLVNLLENS